MPKTPGSLREVLKALQNDHDYLLKGDVFTTDVIETRIDYKMKNKVLALALRPHPWDPQHSTSIDRDHFSCA